MTLVAGFKCRDGFVVGADTEITYGDVLFQGHKLANYSGESKHYDIVIGGAGSASYIASVSQKIQDGVAALPVPSFHHIKRVVEENIAELHRDHLFKYWAPEDEHRPAVELIVGIEDENKKFGIVVTDNTSVSEPGDYAFVGSGSVIAHHVSEKLWVPNLSTASMVHLARQIFREVKRKGTYVGGNTELICRRSFPNAEQFFDVSVKDYRFLWGLDDILMQGVRCAIDVRKSKE